MEYIFLKKMGAAVATKLICKLPAKKCIMQKYKLLGREASTAEVLLTISLALSVILMFTIQFYHYSHLLKQVNQLPNTTAILMAVGIGLMFQLGRFGFAVAGVQEFSTNRQKAGITGMIFSIALSIFESFEVVHIVNDWVGASPLRISCMMILQAIVWISFVLEIRLAINVSDNTVSKSSVTQSGDVLFSFKGSDKKGKGSTSMS